MILSELRHLLDDVAQQKLTVEDALQRLRTLPYEDMGFAKLDHHRALRKGFPEVVFCQGKTVEQIVAIIDRLCLYNKTILATRAGREVYEAVRSKYEDARYSDMGRVITIKRGEPLSLKGNVLVMSAGTADLPVAEEAAITAEVMGNHVQRCYDVGVAGIHRLLDQVQLIEWADVIIVVAGMEGALASVVGGLASRPVVAVPTSVGYGASFNGLAALLSMLNSCASGVGVVNIDNGFGAATLADAITRVKMEAKR